MPAFLKNQKGISALEMLIAMTLIVMAISATLPLVTGGQAASVDVQTNQEALYKAETLLQEARATAKTDYSAVVTTNLQDDDSYKKQIQVIPESLTQCGKDVRATVMWTTDNRPRSVDLTTRVADLATAQAMGGNCDATPPPILGWNPPDTLASSNFGPGSPTSLDALNHIVYMTGNGNPNSAKNFYIADTRGVLEGASGGLFVDFHNNFKADAKLNDVRVARLSDGKTYAFVARDTNVDQFGVIDVSDIHNPVSRGIFQLKNVDEDGSYPQAWRIYYYNNRVYVTTRFTAGPELHIFDVSNPNAIYEMGSGAELGLTVNGLVVTEKTIGEVFFRFAYMATSSDSRELFVLDLTNPLEITEVTGASWNLINPDYADGNAVFLVGNNLYFGRDSSRANDLYVFDATNPMTASGGLPVLRTADVSTSVIGLTVTGPYIFMATTKNNAKFQVWTSNPSQPLTKVNTTNSNFPNIITLGNGLKYEDNWVYVASQANDALRILYNNP